MIFKCTTSSVRSRTQGVHNRTLQEHRGAVRVASIDLGGVISEFRHVGSLLVYLWRNRKKAGMDRTKGPIITSICVLFFLLSVSSLFCQGQSVQGWVERIDVRYIVFGAYAEKQGNDETKFVIKVDGKEYDLVHFKDSKTKETSGVKPYTKMSIPYQSLFETLGGKKFLQKVYHLEIGAKAGNNSEVCWFFDKEFYPSPYYQIDESRIEVKICSRQFAPIKDRGEDLWLSSTKKTRAFYGLAHTTGEGATDFISADYVGDGLYLAELPDNSANSKESKIDLVVKKDGMGDGAHSGSGPFFGDGFTDGYAKVPINYGQEGNPIDGLWSSIGNSSQEISAGETGSEPKGDAEGVGSTNLDTFGGWIDSDKDGEADITHAEAAGVDGNKEKARAD